MKSPCSRFQHYLLLVDKSFVASETRQFLVDQDYGVLWARSVADALALLDTITPDLILLWHLPPKQDAVTLCAQLREQPRLAEVPILIVSTGGGHRTNGREGSDAGATAVVKALPLPALLEPIRQYI